MGIGADGLSGTVNQQGGVTVGGSISPDKSGRRSKSGSDDDMRETAPPGWSGSVKAMKKHMPADKAFALAWWMHKKGYEPHVPEESVILQYERTQMKESFDREVFTIGQKVLWRGGAATLLGEIDNMYSLTLLDGSGTVVHHIPYNQITAFPVDLDQLLKLADEIVHENLMSESEHVPGQLIIRVLENSRISIYGSDRELKNVAVEAFYAAHTQLVAKCTMQPQVLLRYFSEWFNEQSKPGDVLMVDLSDGLASVYNESTGDGYSLGHWGGIPDTRK